MKKLFILLVVSTLIIPGRSFSQGGLSHSDIKGGFYMKLGPSIPVGKFKDVQVFKVDGYADSTRSYLAAKTGPALDLGFLIYVGPTFAKKFLRAGIDLTFLTFNFQKTVPDDIAKNDNWDYFFYFAGQKIGPVITINPIDRLMIDVSYKLNGYVARYFDNEWGKNYTQNEASLSVRYRVVVFSVQYNWGNTRFNYFKSENPVYSVPTDTFRIMFGIKI